MEASRDKANACQERMEANQDKIEAKVDTAMRTGQEMMGAAIKSGQEE
jgi:hypothetical protein